MKLVVKPRTFGCSIIESMSGHSKWSTIKRKKEVEDIKKGKVFSKLSRAISIAVKVGGSADPEVNPKLRVAIDQAKAANMPKENIERAIQKGGGAEGELEEIKYEGFAPGGVGVIVEVATDNKRRTAQEIKNLFERGGGNLAGPGAVSFNFEPKGLLLVEKKGRLDNQMLTIIDAGVEDLEETEDAIEAYVKPDKLSDIKEKLESLGFKILSLELVQKPKNLQVVEEPNWAQKILKFLEGLENQDDVLRVYANLDIPNEVMKMVEKG